jgi:hypothetical protein
MQIASRPVAFHAPFVDVANGWVLLVDSMPCGERNQAGCLTSPGCYEKRSAKSWSKKAGFLPRAATRSRAWTLNVLKNALGLGQRGAGACLAKNKNPMAGAAFFDSLRLSKSPGHGNA